MADLPHVTWLRAFEAAARHSSFSAAAEELGLTPAAVSQQIRLLEKHLKVTLFERLARGVALTDMGQAYAQPIRKSFADMALATKGLFNVSRKRMIDVRASISCAALVIAPRLAEFQDQHPDIAVHLSTFVWADRFGDAQSDVDIRYGHGDWTDGSVTHLGHEFAIPVCHPDYAASFGNRLSIKTLAEAEVVKIAGSETDWLRLSEHYGLNLGHPSSEMHMDSSTIALQAVIAGRGTAMVLESFARHYLRNGLLVAPVEHRLPIRPSHFLVQCSGSDRADEVRAFSHWVMSIYKS
ncbi:MAG: LysR family transcriptional regulator [Albidovulum sp.]